MYVFPVQKWNLQVWLGALRKFVACWVATLVAFLGSRAIQCGALYKLNIAVSSIPISSMYRIFSYIYPIDVPDVGKYSIPGAYGINMDKPYLTKF